ncbi:hypothetical protein HYFRA_00001777 [Hymenoscyphus fraxineus]|uniref:Cytochrome P450 alkane hydroxylase n=1 Tax=Hymenoscyphus fraxineus TaxID=746836 RepID=A0A9N9KNE0_9HELO|nr:hypothetical protein HYFRA_00001777 [Hymenoscyphus fraxineus]
MSTFKYYAGAFSLWFLISQLLKWSRSYAKRRRIISQNGCEPPKSIIQKDPVFGFDIFNDQVLQGWEKNSRNKYFANLFNIYGSTFQARMFHKRLIYTNSPENIQAIHTTDFESFGVSPVRAFPLRPIVGRGIISSDGLQWKGLRAAVCQRFAPVQAAQIANIENHVDKLLSRIPQDGIDLDLQILFQDLALNTTMEFLFGASLDMESPNSNKEFLEAFHYAQNLVPNRILLPPHDIFTTDPKFWSSCRFVHQFVDKQILKTKSKPADSQTHSYSLVDSLLNRTEDVVEIRWHVLNWFLAAHEGIAVPLTNIFFYLARHPRVWALLKAELQKFGSRKVSPKDARGLKYLENVINEAFRLSPNLGTNERVALRDTILPTGGGVLGKKPVFVREGDLIVPSLYTLQRRTDIWGHDAEEFRPERWEEKRESPWTTLPFGGGPRMCPGKEIGLAQVAYTVARICQTFATCVNRDETMEYVDDFRVVSVSRNGAKVAITSV